VPISEDEGPASPEVPSFDSLRDPRRRSALDLLVPGAPPPAAAPPSAESHPVEAHPVEAHPPAGPRPAEWPDLGRFAVRLLRCLLRR
jgi:hypothetical protein